MPSYDGASASLRPSRARRSGRRQTCEESGRRPAAAVFPPTAQPVRAAPRGVLQDLGVPLGLVRGQVLAVVGQAGPARRLEVVQRIGERHVAEPVVVPIGLAVGRDRDELVAVGLAEGSEQTLHEQLATLEQLLEGHGPRDPAVVEEDRDRSAGGQRHAVRPAGVETFGRLLGPHGVAARANARGLMGGENREADPLLGENLQGLGVDGGLGQPHALGLAAEPAAEILDAPADLRDLVAPVRQRQDRVVVGLRDRGAVAREPLAADPVGVEDGSVDGGVVGLEPREKRRPEIEADLRVVVRDAHDPVLLVEDPRRRVGPVTLGRDALVPVVVRVGRVLQLDRLEPGVLPRRLVEVAVDADEAVSQSSAWEAGSASCGRSAVSSSPVRARRLAEPPRRPASGPRPSAPPSPPAAVRTAGRP